MGSITSTILPHHRKAGGEKRCSKPAGRGEGQRSNPERIWGRGRGSQSSSLITLMCDSMPIGNSRHKISYYQKRLPYLFCFLLIRTKFSSANVSEVQYDKATKYCS